MKKKKMILYVLSILMFVGLIAVLIDINKNNYFEINNLRFEIKNLKTEYQGSNCQEKNAINKLDIVSAYGDNEAYHPKVLYFSEGWNGYKYWMAYSPYPHADDSKENPHIAVSNDLITWEAPSGINNPLDEVFDIYVRGKIYNSDPHLVYNSDTNQLECWWRFVDDISDKVIIYRRTSENGINWTEREKIISNKRSKSDYLSPAIIYENGEYHMWYVSKGYSVYYIKSSDLQQWSSATKLDIKYENSKLLTWHIDVIHNDGIYEIVLNSFNKGENRSKMNLYYSKSSDNINWETPKLLLTPSFDSENWDNKGLYRSSLLHVDNKYYLFYSGISWSEERGVGLISGKTIDKLCYQLNNYNY